MTTIVTRLPGTVIGDSALPVYRDYRAIITGHALYTGAWLASEAAYRDDVAGKTRRFFDWKPGGVHHLRQIDTTRQIAIPALDAGHGRVVGEFVSAGAVQYYDLENATFAPGGAWTMMVACKPTAYAGGMIAGAADAGNNRAYLQATVRGSDSKPIIKGLVGDATVQTVADVDPTAWHWAMLAYDGTSVVTLQVDNIEPVVGTVTVEPTITDLFSLGGNALRYVGQFGFLGLIADNIFSGANDAYRAAVKDFLTRLITPAD